MFGPGPWHVYVKVVIDATGTATLGMAKPASTTANPPSNLVGFITFTVPVGTGHGELGGVDGVLDGDSRNQVFRGLLGPQTPGIPQEPTPGST
jgi:hypothetical protein